MDNIRVINNEIHVNKKNYIGWLNLFSNQQT